MTHRAILRLSDQQLFDLISTDESIQFPEGAYLQRSQWNFELSCMELMIQCPEFPDVPDEAVPPLLVVEMETWTQVETKRIAKL